ncbi:hypothetical protein A3L04_05305 [Thermococcus chitonophagus]|uniref:Uncharacterized protein n=1 Tax=Thermococcus chitonophagus TaxID=54262 RepID=A0A161JXH9_9EURY|nr:hypothetical protein [Thermococcus chitonophagus]ASJ16532.1 hypothetical protein A3L04_05305 [Thermococcus chitonophagus]CUX77564.1 hypothetical protein CHITON_0785 [Thermococcus chitonophagus]
MGIFYIFLIWLKLLIRKWSYIAFLLFTLGTAYIIKKLSPIFGLIPDTLVLINMIILTSFISWIYYLSHDPKRILCIDMLPISDWRVSIVSLLTFLPFPVILSMTAPVNRMYYVVLSMVLFLGIADSPLFLLFGALLAWDLSPVATAIFIVASIIKMSLKLIPERKVLLIWIGKTPVTIINPLVLWPISFVIVGMLLIGLTIGNTVKLWASPIGGGVTYFSPISIDKDSKILLLGGIFTALSMILSLMLSLSVSALRYLDNYLWHIKILRGVFSRALIVELVLNAVVGLIMIALPYFILRLFGIGSFRGISLTLVMSLLVSSALAPSPDRKDSLGNFLLGYILIGFTIQWLSIPEKYIVPLLAVMIILSYLLWFKLKEGGRI